MVVQLKGLWLYDYRVYSCTTIRVVVVRLKGIVTRLSRPADCSRQSCWLGSAELLSLVATFEKQSLSTQEVVSFNSKRRLFQLKETSPWTQRNVSLNPKKRLLEPKETSPFAYLTTFFRMNLRYEVLPRPYGKRIRLPRAAEITSRRSICCVPT